MSSWASWGLAACGVSVSFMFALWKYQNNLLYHPEIPNLPKSPDMNPRGHRNPGEHGLPFQNVYYRSEDGTKIHAWLLLQPKSLEAPTVMFFHANAGNIGLYMEMLRDLYTISQVNVFIISYRGYGNSEGTPDEAGIKLDAKAGLAWLLSNSHIDPKNIFLFGRSLGGAVAISLAHSDQQKVRGIIVENTFTSISDMVDAVMPFVSPVKGLVLRIDWNSLAAIPDLTTPLLFISGEQDELVPPAQMKKLYSAAANSLYKQFEVVPEGTHNDTSMRAGRQYYLWIKSFIEKVVGGSSSL